MNQKLSEKTVSLIKDALREATREIWQDVLGMTPVSLPPATLEVDGQTYLIDLTDMEPRDDTALSWDEWNAKVDALLRECGNEY